MFQTAKLLVVAAVLGIGSTIAVAQAADDHLLDFEGMSADDRAVAESAHEALDAANQQMCAVMVRLYGDHVARVDDAELASESVSYLERRCIAEAFASHIAHSTAIHDLIHEYAHRHHGE